VGSIKTSVKEKLDLRREMRENPSLGKELVERGLWTENEVAEIEEFRTKRERFVDWMSEAWLNLCSFTLLIFVDNIKWVLIIVGLPLFIMLITLMAHSCSGGEYIRLQDVYQGK